MGLWCVIRVGFELDRDAFSLDVGWDRSVEHYYLT